MEIAAKNVNTNDRDDTKTTTAAHIRVIAAAPYAVLSIFRFVSYHQYAKSLLNILFTLFGATLLSVSIQAS